jgi:hypothetical protein
LSILLAGSCAVLAAAEITLAENGKSNAAIVIPAKAKPIVRFAARELAEHLEMMTGAKFPVGVKPGPGVNFYLGFGDAKGFESDEFVIDARGNRIDIYGYDTSKPVKLFNYYYDNTEKGTLCGVHYFLDSLGIRWLAPGKDGVHIPKRKTLRTAERQLRFKPFFYNRKVNDGYNFMQIHPDAKHYVKDTDGIYLWGIRNHASPRNMVGGSHSERHLKLFQNPEWLAHPSAHQLMKNGKRNPHYSCWTDPFTKEIWMRAADGYFSGKSPKECGFANLKGYLGSKWPFPFFVPDEFMITTEDYYGGNDARCWCDRCQEFRKKHPCKDDTEILWKLIAEVAGMVEKKYPGCFIATCCYPPMNLIPKLTKVPKNVRVRVQTSGPSYSREGHAKNLKFLRSWSEIIGPKNLPVGVYQCAAGFGNALPGIMDTYPHLWSVYIRDIKPLCAGLYCQNINLTHTQRNLDVYIFMRLMWNPDLDIEKELDEYFRLYYGPAAAPARKLFSIFENNWKRIVCEILSERKMQIGLAVQRQAYFRKQIWSRIYTPAEMKKIDGLMAEIIRLVPKGSVYSKRAGLLQKYIVELMKEERSYAMDKEEIRQKLKLTVGSSTASDFPTDAEWSKAPEYQLISARRMSPELKAAGSFRVLASSDQLFIRADLKEPKMSDSKTDPTHKSGNRDIWKDNCIELFFHAEKSKKFWHIMVNDNNAWSSRTKGKVLIRWEQMMGLKVKTQRKSDGWTADITIPLKELKTNKTGLRFNLTRERNVKGQAEECATWSPLATSGNWHDPENYGSIIFK